MAQGSKEYCKKLVSLEIVEKLLEFSLNGKNESFQVIFIYYLIFII